MKGFVSLVGVGPGDPGLLTLKAVQRIREAYLLIYDYLANPDHLVYAKKNAVALCVGKGFRHKKWSQEKINRLIISAARKGIKVARLKGGDPYLFGRGGEEAVFLRAHGIPFEVIPGVTSATACAAYAGIPLTHRDHNASVTFFTGHRAGDKRLNGLRWKEMVRLGGTLAIYMGFYNLSVIVGQLKRHGMAGSTPAAVVEWGTLPRQKTVEGNLENIAQRAQAKKLKAPAMIFIGEVVRLRKQLGWYEKLPLFGKRILVTRASEDSRHFKERLSAEGARVFEMPVIQIKPPSSYGALDCALKRLGEYDWVFFTSRHGVEAVFDRLKNYLKKDARAFAGVKIASVGPQTSGALRREGIEPDLEPKKFETAEMLKMMKRQKTSLRGLRLALFRTQIAPQDLEKNLKTAGAQVERIIAYRTVRPPRIPQEIRQKLLRKEIDAVTFTSASTVRHFVELLGLGEARKISRYTRLASIGPVTSKELRRHGLRPSREAKIYTTDGLVEALKTL